MAAEAVTLILFIDAEAESAPEAMVAEARQAIALDTVDKAMRCDSIDDVVVVTNSTEFARDAESFPVRVDLDSPEVDFDFGRRLREVIARYEIQRALYMGGGSGALLSAQDLERIARELLSAPEILVTNNLYSTDFAGFSPADAIERVPPPSTDNNLSWLLGEELGLPTVSLPRTAATQFDVDTPSDLMILRHHPGVPPRTRKALDSQSLDASRVEVVMELLTSREHEIMVAGRVSMSVASYLESETACRVRLISEERGMRASGRQQRGEALSILGLYLNEVGVEGFFSGLSGLSDAVLLDNRVILAHRGDWPSKADRFRSDLGLTDEIEDPFLREFTRAAGAATAPIIMGGHSLVAGGLYALIEAAWWRHDGQWPQPAPPQPWRNLRQSW